MKRIITTILSVVLATTISAQEGKSLAEIVNELGQGREITKRQYNVGKGYVTNTITFRVGMAEPCIKEECGKEDMSIVVTDGIPLTADATQKERERVKRICSTLDSLMKISEESHYHETPAKDTIIYSLCIKNAKDSIRKYSLHYAYGPNVYMYPDATEMITLAFASGDKPFNPCDKHKWSVGHLFYEYQKPMPKDQCTAFDQKAYLESILPVLKQKGIKAWNFKWTLDDRFDDDQNKYFEEFYGRQSYRKSFAGKATGTIFFIPKEEEKMAVNVFNAIDSLTQIHINKYPQQKYEYKFNVVEGVMSKQPSTHPTDLIDEYADNNKFHLNLTKGEDGYYVAIINSEKAYGIPKDWYKLKSYTNGEKQYIEGAEAETSDKIDQEIMVLDKIMVW